MKRAVIVACWICVIAAGVFLRFDDLGRRPFHADEATGARLAALRMESGGGLFDPYHYHGPLLGQLAIPWCELRGESGWRSMTKSTLRTLPAIAGSLLLLLPLCGRRRFGDGPMLLAAALLATSPLLAYYSRMFIHEPLLVLFGVGALLSFYSLDSPHHGIRWGITGLLIGWMFATKETLAISILSWAVAGAVIAWEKRKSPELIKHFAGWRVYRIPVGVLLLAAAASAGFSYTHGFRYPQGAIDAIRTFFVYQTGAGHDKPAIYYVQLLALPEKSGGFWWFGTPVLLLALHAYASTFRRAEEAAIHRSAIRFLSYAAAGHFFIYSLFSYKTPWLACLPWAHVCLVAGFAVLGFSGKRPLWKFTIVILTVISLSTQFRQARLATGRLESDARNPFAYSPTRPDIEALETWLERLRAAVPDLPLEPASVVGSEYWPLPWYLRSFGKTAYWEIPPDDLENHPLVFAAPDAAEAVARTLAATHVLVPRGLRDGVPLHVFVRNDLWKRWMESDDS